MTKTTIAILRDVLGYVGRALSDSTQFTLIRQKNKIDTKSAQINTMYIVQVNVYKTNYVERLSL